MAQHQLGGVGVIVLVQVPDPCCRVPRAEGNTNEAGGGGLIDDPAINTSAIDLTKSYIFRNKSQSVVRVMHDSSCFSTDRNSP